MEKSFEVRDIVYGFITFDEWEREIINHPVFQRLRRIKQLSLTDMVYPGANHTRFEHSLGVMHLATLIYDDIRRKRNEYLKNELKYDESGFERDKRIIRFAALLHDIGHTPFSHAGEEVMELLPEDHKRYEKGKENRYTHEDYSIYIIKNYFRDLIEDHPMNNNYDIKREILHPDG